MVLGNSARDQRDGEFASLTLQICACAVLQICACAVLSVCSLTAILSEFYPQTFTIEHNMGFMFQVQQLTLLEKSLLANKRAHRNRLKA